MTNCVSHIGTWIVSINSSVIDSVEMFLSRAVKCLVMCKEQSALFKETERWTESNKRDYLGESAGGIY